MDNTTNISNTQESLSSLADKDKLAIVARITEGCKHLYSKGVLQKDRLIPVLNDFMKLADEDPIFLGQFLSWVMTKSDDKDLKLVATYANSLSDADGTPFSAGSKYSKPNLRFLSQAAIQMSTFDTKQIERLLEIANTKVSLNSGRFKNEATHFSKSLKTAIVKYIRFREKNPKVLEGIAKVGFKKKFRNLYRTLHISPSTEAASILGWKQKDGREITKFKAIDFTGLNELQIAEKIRAEKLPYTGVIGALPMKITPVIALAILEQATGNQAVILRSMFDEQGLLKHKEVLALFEEKIKTAKTALDRVDKLNTEIDQNVQNVLRSAKAEKRKEEVGLFEKMDIQIDISGSMEGAIKFAKDYGSIFAECVSNPETNLTWGAFNTNHMSLPLPDVKKGQKFEKDFFASALYSVKAGGGTNMFAGWDLARKNKVDVQVYISDFATDYWKMNEFKATDMPKTVVFVAIGTVSTGTKELIKNKFESLGVTVSEINPKALTESALVASTIKAGIKGNNALIEEIQSMPLLKLPSWWDAIESK